MAKLALGRGLGALLPSEEKAEKQVEEVVKEKYNLDDSGLKSKLSEVSIDLIDPNPFQPRIEFSPEALDELKNSIVEHGLIQPLSVRVKANNRYELIAGERRLRASKLAKIKTVPVYILDIKTDQEMLELAIIENIHREQLNAIEIALGYKRLIDDCDLTQEQVSHRVAKDRTTVTNFLRLLKLPDYIQKAVSAEKLSMGHARALVSVEDAAFLKSVFEQIIEENLSVREVERLVKAGPQEKNKKSSKTNGSEKQVHPSVVEVEQRLRSALGTKVKIKEKTKGQGDIIIEYYSDDELERLLDLFESAQ